MAAALSRRSFLKLIGYSALATTTATLGAAAYGFEIEAEWLSVHEETIILPRLASAYDGYRIAHLSDIHIDDVLMTREHWLTTVRMVNAQKPDLVAISGDFITHDPSRYAEDLAAGLAMLEAPDGVVGVLGNHDYWGDGNGETVRQVLQATGIHDLTNRAISLNRGASKLHLAGHDDLWPNPIDPNDPSTMKPVLDRLVTELPNSDAAIILVHEPDTADFTASYNRFDLQLSGHAHGGQVRVPVRGALLLPYLGMRYPDHRYDVGSLVQFTSWGLGCSWPQVRFGCRPEIVILSLACA